MNTGKLADGVTWWLAGWKPGARPVVGAAVSFACSLAVVAFWGYLPVWYAADGLVHAIDGVLLKLGMQPGWRSVLYALCLIGALAQVVIAAFDLFAPAAVRLRAGARAVADLTSAMFGVSVILGFGLDPREALQPGVWIGGWVAAFISLITAGQIVRALANLHQAIRGEAATA